MDHSGHFHSAAGTQSAICHGHWWCSERYSFQLTLSCLKWISFGGCTSSSHLQPHKVCRVILEWKTHRLCFCCPAQQCTEGSDAPLSPAEIWTHIRGAELTKPRGWKEGWEEERKKGRQRGKLCYIYVEIQPDDTEASVSVKMWNISI